MKNTVTNNQINEIMSKAKVEVQTILGKCTVVSCQLPNGFIIVESSACVDPANYDENLGANICLERIRNKVWELEGYVLQTKLSSQEQAHEEVEEVVDGENESTDALCCEASKPSDWDKTHRQELYVRVLMQAYNEGFPVDQKEILTEIKLLKP